MFTGLVETKGTLVRRTAQGRDARLVVRGDFGIERSSKGAVFGREPLVLGESIAVDGVCLTVAAIPTPGGPGPSVFEVDVSSESLDKTTLGSLAIGATVNIERAMPLGGRMGGHVVSGHVDGVGRIREKVPVEGAVKITFAPPPELMRFFAPKGSICINGVSLTVNGVADDRFDVMIIPHTREKTSLDALPVGAPVNLEIDMLARYVARLLEGEKRGLATGAGSAGGHGSVRPDDTTETREHADGAAWLARLKRAGYV